MTECIYSELPLVISCSHITIGTFQNKYLLFLPFKFLCPCAILGGIIACIYVGLLKIVSCNMSCLFQPITYQCNMLSNICLWVILISVICILRLFYLSNRVVKISCADGATCVLHISIFFSATCIQKCRSKILSHSVSIYFGSIGALPIHVPGPWLL
jgi:ethanolamine transporter EutH